VSNLIQQALALISTGLGNIAEGIVGLLSPVSDSLVGLLEWMGSRTGAIVTIAFGILLLMLLRHIRERR